MCGHCLLIYENRPVTGAESRGYYMATGGTVTLTDVFDHLTGTITNATFEHVEIDLDYVSTPRPDVVTIAAVVYGWMLLRPPPGLKAGDVYYGGPAGGLIVMFFVGLPLYACMLVNVAGIAYTIYSLARRRGFWPALACLLVAVLWLGVLALFEAGDSGVTRLGG